MKTSSIWTKLKNILTSILVSAIWILVWQVASKTVGIEAIIPSVESVGKRIFQLATTSSFWHTIALSCARVGAGFLFAITVGFIMGTLSARFNWVHRLFRPMLRVVSTTPVASFIILALIWIKTNRLPIFITFLMVLPVIWNNVYSGLKSTDKNLLEMTQIYKFSNKDRWESLYLPTLKPYFYAAAKTGINFAWKAGIAAEVIAQPKPSIGTEIYLSKIYLETVDLFAWTIVVILLSFVLEGLSMKLLDYLKGGGTGGTENKQPV